jgi:uncharacterized UBP type Zn finger protein
MKECPEKKILNPITNRCVNINGKIGKSILKNNYNINISNENNSCYIDSLFVALFHFKNRVLYNSFFRNKLSERYPKKIQEEIFKIYRYINKNEDISYKQCYFIRKYLDKYYNILINQNSNNKIFFNSSDNWRTQQIDIFELLTFLDKIFNFEQNIKIKDGNNKYIKNMIVEISSYNLMNINVLDISTLIPIKIEKYNLDRNNYYTNSKGELIKYYEKKYEIIKTKGILFIQLYRNTGTDKLTTKIIYPNKINIKGDKKPLLLRSIILHKGSTINSGHYTTIIKIAGKTYEYDDIRKSDNKLAEIDEEYEKKMSKNVVGLIYSK